MFSWGLPPVPLHVLGSLGRLLFVLELCCSRSMFSVLLAVAVRGVRPWFFRFFRGQSRLSSRFLAATAVSSQLVHIAREAR
jgi:hypothetical protein